MLGRKLCIPKAAFHADKLKQLPKKYLNQGAAYFNAAWTPAGIGIKPLNFPVESSLLVRVDDLGDQAIRLSLQANRITGAMPKILCPTWDLIASELELSAEQASALGELRLKLRCDG